MDQRKLDKVNAERRRRGRRELSMAEAKRHGDDAGFDFLVGLTTGVGISPSGMIGAAIHNSMPDPSPSCDDSSSSSSCDSGGSSGGGD